MNIEVVANVRAKYKRNRGSYATRGATFSGLQTSQRVLARHSLLREAQYLGFARESASRSNSRDFVWNLCARA